MTHDAVPKKTYYLVFAALLVLTATTAAVAYVDLGPFNVYVALTIAFIKALLVILFFMHVKQSDRITKVVVGASLFWLTIMIAYSLTDYMSRGWLGIDRGW
jgi:cytochrome c oxidase subunit 4